MDMECVMQEKFEEHTKRTNGYNCTCRDVESTLFQIVSKHGYSCTDQAHRGSNGESKAEEPIAVHKPIYVVQIQSYRNKIAWHENRR